MKYQQIREFPDQLEKAWTHGKQIKVHKGPFPVHQVFIAGTGTAGTGARIVSDMIREECPVPLLIGKGYHIPAYVNKYTLAIACSFSGNTEEIVSAFDQMVEREAKVIVITSGGRLLKKAKLQGIDYIRIPADWSTDRTCLGYYIVTHLFLLHELGIIAETRIKEVIAAKLLLEQEQASISEKAKEIARFLAGKIPVIYTVDRMEGVAVRLRQQLNQNSKTLCWHHMLPEMNHTELAGWRQANKQLAVLFLRNKKDYYRNQVRIDINKEIISNYTPSIFQVYSQGQSFVEQVLYLCYLSDWVSVCLSNLNRVDPDDNEVIDYLKKELDEIHLNLFNLPGS